MNVKKKIAAVAAAAMVLSSVPLIAFAGDCNGNNTSLVNSDDADRHQVTCDGTDCPVHGDAESPKMEDHTFGSTYEPANVTEGDTTIYKHKQTCDCGYEKVTVCSGSSWENTTDGHVKKCDDCEQVLEEKEHTAKEAWENSAEKHWHACSVANDCTEKLDEAEHEWEDKSDASGHFKKCKVCDYETTPKTAHAAADNAAWLDDGTNHYKTCKVDGCSEKVNSATHSAGSFKQDATNHWKECSVCKKVSDKAAHSATDATWKKAQQSIGNYVNAVQQ